MHIEIDTIELTVLVIAWFSVKWFFRAMVMFLVAKVIGAVMDKGRKSVEEIKAQVSGLGKGQANAEGGNGKD